KQDCCENSAKQLRITTWQFMQAMLGNEIPDCKKGKAKEKKIAKNPARIQQIPRYSFFDWRIISYCLQYITYDKQRHCADQKVLVATGAQHMQYRPGAKRAHQVP